MEIKPIINSLVDLFFPMRCLNCQDTIQSSQLLCVLCTSKLPFTHWNFDQDNFIYQKLTELCRIEKAYSLLYFKNNNITQKLLHEMKYKNRPEIGIDLAKLIKIDFSQYDGIIPIPLHPRRMKVRGYNQVDLFSKELAEMNQIRFFPQGLVRIMHQPSQVSENKEQRMHNLKDSFKVNPSLGRGNYILVDDIVTTGATIASAVKVFNLLDGYKISVVSIACA